MKENVISINVYAVIYVFDEDEPYDWILGVKDIDSGEYSEIKIIGNVGDTLIRVRYNKLIVEDWWGLETRYKKESWHTYSKSKLLELKEEYKNN